MAASARSRSAPPAAPTLPAGTIHPASDGSLSLPLSCSDRDAGCGGTITAALPGRALGSQTYAIAPGQKATVRFPGAGRAAGTLSLTVKPTIGTAPTAAGALTVAGR